MIVEQKDVVWARVPTIYLSMFEGLVAGAPRFRFFSGSSRDRTFYCEATLDGRYVLFSLGHATLELARDAMFEELNTRYTMAQLEEMIR